MTTTTTQCAALHSDIILIETMQNVRTSLGRETLMSGERFTIVDSYCVSDSDRCIVLAAMGIRIMAWITLGTRGEEFTIRIGSQDDRCAARVRAAA